MTDFFQTTGQGRRQKADSEVFREVLAALQRSEVLQSELERSYRTPPSDRRRSTSEREALLDVTEGKLAEAALLGSKAELLLANSYLMIAQRLSKTGSFTWNLRTNERRWSEEMYRIFEVEPNGPVPAARASQVIHPDDMTIFDALVARARTGKDFDGELRVMTPRGAVKHVHVVGNLVGEARERPVFVGAVQDVTDRKLAEEALARARSELAHVARATALSALTASIAHEVNQPLAGIITNASVCLRMLAVDPPNIEGARATAERTIRDSNRASEVIMRLRALFAGKPAAKEPIDVNDAAREILVLSASELQSARVVLQTDFAADLPAVVGDRVQLQQVILLLNASQAMRDIDGRPHDLRVSTASDADRVTLSVRDTGVGSAAQDLEQLFNTFYTTKPDGMGVGLSLSRSIIEAHGGRLWASTNDGPGLTVSFSLPVASSPTGRLFEGRLSD
jgi:signal transduction histidine kinase